MLDLSTAVLCDFAQVRDRLLFVSSGAVSRLYRQELPSPLGMMVGLVIEVPLEDAGMDHRLRAEVINRHGTVLATLENLFRVSDAGLFPHEVQQVPLVLSITGVRARTWGTHQVRLYLDEELVRALTLYVVPAAGPQAVVRATPTQSRVADDEGSLGGTGTDGVADEAPADEPAVPDSVPQPVEWGAPVETTADDAPGDDEAPDSSTLVISLEEDEPLTFELDLGTEAPADDTEPTEAPADATDLADTDTVDTDADGPGDADDPVATDGGGATDGDTDGDDDEAPAEPEPEADPSLSFRLDSMPTEPVPTWRGTATIDAPTVTEAEPVGEPPVFDFDEDDLDADPADRDQALSSPSAATASEPKPEKSRFSFRYRYDDDETS